MRNPLIIRLQREKNNSNIYHIIITYKSSAKARKDSLGKVSKLGGNYALVSLNQKKLKAYMYQGINISESFAKILGVRSGYTK